MLRRLRGRFGISAPQVSIRTHVPWRLRVTFVLAVFVVLSGLAVWVFDAGQQWAGFDLGELERLKSGQAGIEEENARLRGLLAASENNLQIEKSAQASLANEQSRLVQENARLKEEVAVLERLLKQRSQSKNSRNR